MLEGSVSYGLGTFTADAPTQAIVVYGDGVNQDGDLAWTLNAVAIYELSPERRSDP